MDGNYFFLLIISCIVFGYIGSYISNEKKRDKTEGFLFGFFLSILGLIILGLLPTKESSQVETTMSNNHSMSDDEVDEKKMYGRLVFALVLIILSLIIYNNL